MSRTILRRGLACLAAIAALANAADPPRETPGLKETQVSIALERGRTRREFRATAMAVEGDVLTVMTAAHCVSDADKDGPALFLRDGEVVEGTVLSVVRNPSYREKPGAKASTPGEVPGPDNAIARFRFRPSNKAAEQAFRTIRPAQALSGRAYPGPSGQAVAVHMTDQHGVEHGLKAHNLGNPRWLQWGPSYKPVPGDSGGGVFALQPLADGTSRPVLIGVIVGNDPFGGGASIVSRDQKWIADALPKPAPSP